MADLSYPSLPGALVGTFRESGLDPWVSDQGEVGAARRRKRFTRSLGRWSFTSLLTNAQRDTLVAFYGQLDEGVDAFNWTHPTTGTVHEVRFSQRPALQDKNGLSWIAEIALEEI